MVLVLVFSCIYLVFFVKKKISLKRKKGRNYKKKKLYFLHEKRIIKTDCRKQIMLYSKSYQKRKTDNEQKYFIKQKLFSLPDVNK